MFTRDPGGDVAVAHVAVVPGLERAAGRTGGHLQLLWHGQMISWGVDGCTLDDLRDGSVVGYSYCRALHIAHWLEVR